MSLTAFEAALRDSMPSREEIAAMPLPTERLDAVLKDVWTPAALEDIPAGFAEQFLNSCFNPQPLDEWLAEDNPHRLSPYKVPGVLEALGLS